MYKFFTAIAAAMLMVGQLFTQVNAASSTAELASTTCGDTYTVTGGDYLAKIARTCGVTVSEILALNPQITNANLVYSGQVLRMTSSADWTITQTDPSYWANYYTSQGRYYSSGSYSGFARVGVSTTRADVGDTVTVYLSGFPAYASVDYRVGEWGEDYTDVYDGTVDSDGSDSQTITIPADANVGERWVVLVTTTSQVSGVDVYSPIIYIVDNGGSSSYYGDAQVSVSDTSVEAGDSITVYVNDFPPNASIDYRIGEKGEDYSVVYDGSTDSDGDDSLTITIPSDADDGERWVVHVITTDQVEEVDAYSATIYIND